MQLTARTSGKLQGRTPLELHTGETPEFSEYLDLGWYDIVWCKENAGLGKTKLGRFLGTSHKVVSSMSYWVLPKTGIPISRTTVQRVTHFETQTEANRKRFEQYDTSIIDRSHEVYTHFFST